jgi:hypothetical protein
LVDAAWTPDGRNLIVCSTDGYISILRFAVGELGQVYVVPPITTTAAIAALPHQTSAAVATSKPSQPLAMVLVVLPSLAAATLLVATATPEDDAVEKDTNKRTATEAAISVDKLSLADESATMPKRKRIGFSQRSCSCRNNM